MTRFHSSLFGALSIVALATGCSTGEKVDSPIEETCDEDKVGEDCTCSGKREGLYECNSDDELERVGDDETGDDEETPPADDDEDDDPAPTEDDDDEPAPMTGKQDAGSSGSKSDARVSGGGSDAKTPPASPDAGSSGGGDPTPPVVTEGEPTIPPINGECPEFKNNSTIMVAGHRSIEIKAGAAGM